MSTKRMSGNWFNINNGFSCGLVVPENVMKKLAKLFTKHNDEVKDLLTKHKDEIYAYDWTLAYPNKKQEVVAFNAKHTTVEERIDNYDENLKIHRLNDFYVSYTEDYEKRREEAIQLYMDKYDDGETEEGV